jgi:hypothetical protein
VILPSHYIAETESSDVGHCSEVTAATSGTNCSQPTTSVLFDSDIPSNISELDNTNGGHGLLTMSTITTSNIIVYDFTHAPGYTGIQRMEIIMFNCREQGTAVRRISYGMSLSSQLEVNNSLYTCASLVRICISYRTTSPVISMLFTTFQPTDKVHLAEVTFYINNSTCPPNGAILMNPWPSTTSK